MILTFVRLFDRSSSPGGVWTTAAFALRVLTRAEQSVKSKLKLEKEIIPTMTPSGSLESMSRNNSISGVSPYGSPPVGPGAGLMNRSGSVSYFAQQPGQQAAAAGSPAGVYGTGGTTAQDLKSR